MEKKTKFSPETIAILQDVAVLILGVLLLFLKDSILSIILGAAFVALGVTILIIDIISKKKAITERTILEVSLISFGIIGLIGHLPFSEFFYYSAIVLGSILLLDMVFGIAFKTQPLVTAILVGVIGAAILTIGILFLTVDKFRSDFFFVLGIVLIVVALYMLITELIRINKKKNS